MVFLRIVMYILLALAVVAALFGLNILFVKLVNRYADKMKDGESLKQKKIQFNKGPLIIAGIFIIITLLPRTNNILFLVMTIIFILRSLYGKLTVFRGVLLTIGSFILGVFITSIVIEIIKPVIALVLLIVAIPLIILGFYTPLKARKTESDSG